MIGWMIKREARHCTHTLPFQLQWNIACGAPRHCENTSTRFLCAHLSDLSAQNTLHSIRNSQYHSGGVVMHDKWKHTKTPLTLAMLDQVPWASVGTLRQHQSQKPPMFITSVSHRSVQKLPVSAVTLYKSRQHQTPCGQSLRTRKGIQTHHTKHS